MQQRLLCLKLVTEPGNRCRADTLHSINGSVTGGKLYAACGGGFEFQGIDFLQPNAERFAAVDRFDGRACHEPPSQQDETERKGEEEDSSHGSFFKQPHLFDTNLGSEQEATEWKVFDEMLSGAGRSGFKV